MSSYDHIPSQSEVGASVRFPSAPAANVMTFASSNQTVVTPARPAETTYRVATRLFGSDLVDLESEDEDIRVYEPLECFVEEDEDEVGVIYSDALAFAHHRGIIDFDAGIW